MSDATVTITGQFLGFNSVGGSPTNRVTKQCPIMAHHIPSLATTQPIPPPQAGSRSHLPGVPRGTRIEYLVSPRTGLRRRRRVTKYPIRPRRSRQGGHALGSILMRNGISSPPPEEGGNDRKQKNTATAKKQRNNEGLGMEKGT